MSIFRSFSTHARVTAFILCIGVPAALAAPAASYDPDALKLALAWEKIKFQIDDPAEQLKQMDENGMTKQVANLLGLAEVSQDDNINAFYRRYLVLALEAYRREKISKRKLIEIATKLGVDALEIENVIETLGLVHDEPAEVLLPSV